MNKKFKGKFKNKISKQTIFGFILGALIFGTIGVGASTLLYGSDVTYDNSSSGMSATTVQEALDELYEQAKSGSECPEGYACSLIHVKDDIVTIGDGLYADMAESGRYIYKGSSPSNYITFNDEIWRIISIESDGKLKIIRNEQLSSTQVWDKKSNRSSTTSTYCTNASSYGCNAWAATKNLIGTASSFVQYFPVGNPSNYSEIYTGTVTKDASLNTYLNGTYYNGLSSAAQIQVVQGTFNVSTPGYYTDTETLEADFGQEKQYQWQGYVALMTVTELLKASTSSSCTSLNAGYSKNCSDNNWLWPTFNTSAGEWTLSTFVHSDRDYVWDVNSGGNVGYSVVTNSFGVRPVVFLSSNITLSGSGTSSDPYTIN